MSDLRLIPNTFQTFNAHVDVAMHLLSGNEYKVLNFATRHILGWQSNLHDRTGEISLSTFVNGFTTQDGRVFHGCGLTEPTVKDILAELVKYRLMEKIGKPTQRGQSWRIGESPDWAGLNQRALDKAEADKAKISKARNSRGKQPGGVVQQPPLSNNPPEGLSNNPPEGLSNNLHTNPSLNPSLNPLSGAAGAGVITDNDEPDVTFDDLTPIDWTLPATRQDRLRQAVFSVWGYPVESTRNWLLMQMLRGKSDNKTYRDGNIPESYRKRFEPEELTAWSDWYMSQGIQGDNKELLASPVKIQASIMEWIDLGKPKVESDEDNRELLRVTAAQSPEPALSAEERAEIRAKVGKRNG